jgi:dipeptide/tripeptide permease
MSETKAKKFSFKYWLVIFFEFIERGSYYGVMSVFSMYLIDTVELSKMQVGWIKSTIQPILYFLPVLTGAIADKVGYKKTLLVAFALMAAGYGLTSQFDTYSAIFISMIILALGAGTFKPIVSGTIAQETNEKTATLGFSIFYWSINFGAFIVPLVVVPALKKMDPSYILIFAAIATGAMLLPTLFLFKDNQELKKDTTEREPIGAVLADIFKKVWMVVLDWRFILFIFIYSIFWILYFQMYDTVLWYVDMFVDATPLNNFVKNLTGLDWKFDVEHVTVINAGTIILLQLAIAAIVRKTKTLPTLIVGIALGVAGMAILAFGGTIWIFMIGTMIFSLGEMIAHPKYIAYLGTIAPKDKKATYMGFGFLYGFFGSLFAGITGAWLYEKYVDNPMIAFIKQNVPTLGEDVTIKEALEVAATNGIEQAQVLPYAHTTKLWLIFSSLGVVCIIALLLYNKFIGVRTAAKD